MGNVFAYARVSTPRQGEKGVSLQEQRSAIERYAEQHGLTITRWFEERESAAKRGRAEFATMLRLIRLKAAQGVIIHKIDRGARNLEDWADLGKLADAGADIHFATESLDLRTVAGRLSADIQAVVAAHYSRNLREEVRKGFYGRLKQGFYPLPAPIGYLDQGKAKNKIIDPIRAPLVREAFRRYSTGGVSLLALTKEMYDRGLRNRHGSAVTMTGWATILKNPFYLGLMKIRKTEQTFRGGHEPLIATDLFEKVQEVLAGKRVDRSESHVYTFSRIVRCASCKYSLVGERQRGHVYYRCHNRAFKTPAVCPRTSIREEEIETAVTRLFSLVELTPEEVQVIHLLIEERKQQWNKQRESTERALKLQHEQIASRLSKLADLLIEGSIDRSLYQAKQKAFLSEQAAIQQRLLELQNDSDAGFRRIEKAVELAKSASMLYKTAPLSQKRELLKTVLSNISVSSKNVEISLAVPFRMIADRDKSRNGAPYRGTCRTWEQILNMLQQHFVNCPIES